MKNKQLYRIEYIRQQDEEPTKIRKAIVSKRQIDNIDIIPWIVILSKKEYYGRKSCVKILE